MYVLPGIAVWLVLYPLITSCFLGWRFKGIYNPPTVTDGEEEEAIKKLQRKVRNTKFYYGFFIVGLKNGITNQLVAKDRWWNMDPIKNCCLRVLVWTMIIISTPIGYLTGRGRLILVNNFASVVSSFYYWEFYTYYVKALLVVVMSMFNVSRHLRLLTAIVILGIYTGSTLASEPYQSRKLNHFNSSSVLVVLFYALLKLVVVDVTPNPIPGLDTAGTDEINAIAWINTVLISLIGLYFLCMMYTQMLLYVYERGMMIPYKILTLGGCLCCGSCSLASFRQSYYKEEDYICDEDSSCMFELSDDERKGETGTKDQKEERESRISPEQQAEIDNEARSSALNAAAKAFETLKLTDEKKVNKKDLIREARLNGLPKEVSSAKIDKFFKTFDTNYDDVVDKKEWID